MSLERAALRGKLAEAEDTLHRLNLKAEGLCIALRQGLNTALTPFEEIDIPMLDEQWDALKSTWAELIEIKSSMTRLQRELR